MVQRKRNSTLISFPANDTEQYCEEYCSTVCVHNMKLTTVSYIN